MEYSGVLDTMLYQIVRNAVGAALYCMLYGTSRGSALWRLVLARVGANNSNFTTK